MHRDSEPSTPYSLAAPTNPATGKSVVDFFSGASKDLTVVDNGDGTITLRTAVSGVPDEITLSDGTRGDQRCRAHRVRDRDRLPRHPHRHQRRRGTLPIHQSISGPHPEAERGFTLFCPTVVAGLT